MDGEKSTVERAFEIARLGTAVRVEEIARQLAKEGYPDVHGHLGGATIRAQLLQIAQQARS